MCAATGHQGNSREGDKGTWGGILGRGHSEWWDKYIERNVVFWRFSRQSRRKACKSRCVEDHGGFVERSRSPATTSCRQRKRGSFSGWCQPVFLAASVAALRPSPVMCWRGKSQRWHQSRRGSVRDQGRLGGHGLTLQSAQSASP